MQLTIPLTALILLPVIGALLALATRTSKVVALGVTLLNFVFSLFLFFAQNTATAGGNSFFLNESLPWLPEFGLSYRLGVDGVSSLLIVLTTLISVFAVAISPEHPERAKTYYILLLLESAALIGAFAALDLILFFLFFELSLVPLFFLIGIWGGRRRQAAAIKFFVYTTVGSLTMLAGILALHIAVRGLPNGTGVATFDYAELQSALALNPLPLTTAVWIMSAFAFAFAIKTPLWPLHSWQSDTYAESPIAATVIAAAVLSKLGTYGFYRFCVALFPEAARAAAPVFVGLAVVAILYGAIVAITQRDVRRLIAFSSVSHLGFVVLGIFALNSTALTGAVLQMVNHGITTGALFLLVGMLEARRKSTRIRDLGGLWDEMPVFSRVFLVVTLASVALPLTNGFVGEFMILMGAFQTFPGATVFATIGVILSAIYMLWMYQRVFYGPAAVPADSHFDEAQAKARRRDLSVGELLIAAPLVFFIFWLGIAPTPFVRVIQEDVKAVAARTVEETRPPRRRPAAAAAPNRRPTKKTAASATTTKQIEGQNRS